MNTSTQKREKNEGREHIQINKQTCKEILIIKSFKFVIQN